MNDFTELTRRLTELMKASATGMIVARDGDGGLELLAPIPHPLKPKEPLWFGGVRAGKAYVSYHLMPVYGSAALAAKVSPGLKKRMQGKSCFNFTKPDEALFAELAELTRAGAELFSKPLVMAQRAPRKA